jgi:hypothetical protein
VRTHPAEASQQRLAPPGFPQHAFRAMIERHDLARPVPALQRQ